MKRNPRRRARTPAPARAAPTRTRQPPQEWRLADKQHIGFERLVHDRNDHLGQFLLGLALAFNDLKGLIMFEQYLTAMGRPANDDFSAYAGQWRGMHVQMQRWIGGVLHEILNVLGERRNRAVLAGAELRQLVASVAIENQEAWRELVAVAQAPMNQPNMTRMLQRVRNWTAFHYAGHNLSDGFAELFGRIATTNQTEANRAPQYSLGVDMDGTRFYYADAAAQQVMASQLSVAATTLDEVFAVAQKVNLALASLLRAFIVSRTGGRLAGFAGLL